MIGKFISIEGQDGAGKTTNLDAICDYLKAHKIEYIVTREPGGTELGESLREVILGSDTAIDPVAELLLMFASRVQHIEQVIKPALAKGHWVVSDRFTDATYAYQGGGHELDTNLIHQVEKTSINSFEPDLTLLLDLDVSVGLQRTNTRGERKDRFENQKDAFKERVRAMYLQRHTDNPGRIKLINASQSIEGVHEQVVDTLDAFMAGMPATKE